jgi:hypothetical protein
VNGFATAQLVHGATRTHAERLAAECGVGDAVSGVKIARAPRADGRVWLVEFDLHGSPATKAWAELGSCVTANTDVAHYAEPLPVVHGGEPGHD